MQSAITVACSRTIPFCGFIENIDAKAELDVVEGYIRKSHAVHVIHRVHQVHGDVIQVDTSGEGDGLVVSGKGSAALIRTADCYPVVLADSSRSIAGIFHCGWRGVELHLAAKGVRLMRSLGARTISAMLFPGIGPCCFKIGAELDERFGAAGIPVFERSGLLYADLVEALSMQLGDEGVDTIEVDGRCTCCTPHLYSWRRNNDPRRHAAFVII